MNAEISYHMEGIYLGSISIPVGYGNGRSRIYYCSGCGEVFGQRLVQIPGRTIDFSAAEGICRTCRSPSRYDIPGGIPFFTELDPYPEQALLYQLDRELEYFYARQSSQTTVHPSGDEYTSNGS